jgi:hypothetical protein
MNKLQISRYDYIQCDECKRYLESKHIKSVKTCGILTMLFYYDKQLCKKCIEKNNKKEVVK